MAPPSGSKDLLPSRTRDIVLVILLLPPSTDAKSDRGDTLTVDIALEFNEAFATLKARNSKTYWSNTENVGTMVFSCTVMLLLFGATLKTAWVGPETCFQA